MEFDDEKLIYSSIIYHEKFISLFVFFGNTFLEYLELISLKSITLDVKYL